MTQSVAGDKAMVLVYIIYYSSYGHVAQLVERAEAGCKAAGVDVKVFQVRISQALPVSPRQ